MIDRLLGPVLIKSAKDFPIIGILGPRQSGKTTLSQQIFPNYEYVNLEDISMRKFASTDPKGFLNRYSKHVILDEVQRVPDLFSYLMVKTDKDKISGQYILTGSQNFLLLNKISQSLAGRIALFELYPLSYKELATANLVKQSAPEQIFYGGYPRLYEKKINPKTWFSSYIQTYLDRDISTLSKIDDLNSFEKFLHLVAGRTGNLLNLSSLASDVGVTHNTIKSWISLLATSGIIRLLPPYFANINKRLIKSPKLYFVDTGLACHLLGIESSNQLPTHPLYGSLFETYVVMEMFKSVLNQGNSSKNIFFWRDKTGLEADLYIDHALNGDLYEIKSAQTIPSNPFDSLGKIKPTFNKPISLNLIYGGKENQPRTKGNIFSWEKIK